MYFKYYNLMKNNILVLVLFCLSIILINSCKTDSVPSNDTPAISTNTTVSMRIRGEPISLNPMLTTMSWDLRICAAMYPTLLDYDPFTLKITPVLVKDRPVIKVIEEGDRKGWTTYSYELLDEAVWDDGSPVTAKDYIYTLKTLFNPHVAAAPYRGYLDLIKDATADPSNPKKFTVYTDTKYIKAEYATGLFIYPQYKFDPEKVMDNYTLNDIRNSELAEQHKNDERLKGYGEVFNKMIRDKDVVGGCGPYKLEEWVTNERVVLTKKENWWGDNLAADYTMLTARPRQLIFRPIADATTALSILKNGDLDVVGSIPDSQFDEFKNSTIGQESFNFETPYMFGINYYGFNTKNPKLSDKRVRRAISHLVDIDEIIKTVKRGYAAPVATPFHPLRDYYHKGLEPIKLDIEKAKTLLSEAGWTDSNNNGTVDKNINGVVTEMELDLLITPNNKNSTDMGLIFQNEAKKAGVQINIVEKANKALAAQLRTREFDLFARAIGSEVSGDDPKQYWHTSSDTPRGYNRVGFGNAETDALIDAIRTELDKTKRDELYKKFQEVVYDEQPYVFLYTSQDLIAINKRFQGVETTIKSPRIFPVYWYE